MREPEDEIVAHHCRALMYRLLVHKLLEGIDGERLGVVERGIIAQMEALMDDTKQYVMDVAALAARDALDEQRDRLLRESEN